MYSAVRERFIPVKQHVLDLVYRHIANYEFNLKFHDKNKTDVIHVNCTMKKEDEKYQHGGC